MDDPAMDEFGLPLRYVGNSRVQIKPQPEVQ